MANMATLPWGAALNRNTLPVRPPNQVQNYVKEDFTNEPILYSWGAHPLQPVSSNEQAQPTAMQKGGNEEQTGLPNTRRSFNWPQE